MSQSSTASAQKEPGRFKQIWQVLRMTVKYDKTSLVLLIAAFVVPILIAVGVVLVMGPGNPLMWIISCVLGVMVGLLLFMYTLNWRAEKVAFSQLEGKPGAAGAVLTSSLRGQWQTSDTPVAFNAKTQDAVFRAVGKPGIVLISEGGATVCKRLANDERRRVQRIVPNVDVTLIHVGKDEGDTPLLKLRSTLKKLPKKLQKAEILAVSNRLNSMKGSALPIPKGIDPNRIRPSRAHLR
ncbi:MAG: DUF4191 domain-containing protein [Pseudoclavibacter sp.]